MAVPVLNKLNVALKKQRAERHFGIESLVEVLRGYMTADQVGEVRAAFELGAQQHAGQFRKSGEPYIYHPLAVARILADMRLDSTTLCAAILHDVIEDTDITQQEVAEQFGDDVAALVEGVTKLEQAQDLSKADVQAETYRKLLLAMTQDIRVILVKLADRLHNMRTLGSMKPEKRRRIARETLDIYAPIAQRLGINTMRLELEDLGLKNLYPNRYRVLAASVASVTGERRNIVRQVEEALGKAMRAENLSGTVKGRRKNLYSIYQKMERKHKRFLDVMDLYGFRLIVDKPSDCYRALGVVHQTYKPIGEMFNDYIAAPKVNGYQSLHTTLVGPGGIKIEVQIRTQDMHHIAESGIAAHWQYKVGGPGGAGAQVPQARAREWLSSFLGMDHGDMNSAEFLESVKVDLFPDDVYVFTPKGAIQRLPRGATAIDFAYAIHTELGNHAVSCRINHSLAPLTTQLKNGQVVEIIRSKHGTPNAAWLSAVKTAKARTSIRGFLKRQRNDEAVRLGKRLLERSLAELGLGSKALKSAEAKAALTAFGLPSMQALYMSIGLGERLAPLVARHFVPYNGDSAGGKPGIGEGAPLSIQGTEGMVVEYARCCHPIPGDPIRGHVSSGRGIVIHRSDCTSGLRAGKGPVDWVSVAWAPDVRGNFLAQVRVQGNNTPGFLAKVATEIAAEDSSIDKVSLEDRQGDVSDMRLTLTVEDRVHLARVLRRLRRISQVGRVQRIDA